MLYDEAKELYHWDLQDEGTIGTIGTIDSREDLLVPVAYEESQRNNIEMWEKIMKMKLNGIHLKFPKSYFW